MQIWSVAPPGAEPWMDVLPPPEIGAEQYEAWPEDLVRWIEVVDGRLIMAPRHSLLHQLVVVGLAIALRSQRPGGLRVVHQVDLRLAEVPLHIRRPDIVVYRADLPDDADPRPEDVSLAIEVVAPDSVTADRLHKPAEYAAAGIAHYWRVETDPLVVHTSDRGVHKGRLVTDQPFPVDVDLEALLLG